MIEQVGLFFISLLGAYIGTHLGIKKGNQWIKRGFEGVTLERCLWVAHQLKFTIRLPRALNTKSYPAQIGYIIYSVLVP